MPLPHPPARLSVLAATAAALVTGSGCRDRQESAHENVREASFTFTVSDFVKAAGEGKLSVARSFLEAGMNPNVAAPDGRTPLIAAAAGGRGEVVELLLSNGAKATASAKTKANPPAKVNPSGSPAAGPPAQQAGVTPEPGELTPLLAAVRGGDERAVSSLLKAGASPASNGPPDQAPLTAAALLGHASIVEVLAPLCRDSLDPALHLACGKGHTAAMDVLLNAGADINSPDAQGRTPLMIAAMAGELPALRLLCHRQADPAKKDAEGHSAADLAAGNGHAQSAAFLTDWILRESDPEHSPRLALASASASAFPDIGDGPEVPVGSTSNSPSSTGKDDNPSAPPAPAPASPILLPAGATAPTSFRTSASSPPRGQSEKTGTETEAPPPETRSITSSRFPRLHCDAVNDVPGVLSMTSYQLRPWPLLLKDVDTDHGSADIELPLEDHKIVNLRVGSTIPGTGCVVDKLRRKRIYTGFGKGRKLVNASELTFRNPRTGETFQAAPNTTVLSTESSAHLRIAGSPILWTAAVGNEFRLGTTLLKITAIDAQGLTLENRLTRESAKIPLAAPVKPASPQTLPISVKPL